MRNMIVVDNNDAKEDELLKVYKQVRRLINVPVQNYVKKYRKRTTIKETKCQIIFKTHITETYVKELLKEEKIVDDVNNQ